MFGLSVTDLPGSPRRSSIPSAFAGHLIDVPADTEDGEDIVGFVSIVGVVSDTVIVGGSGGEYPEPPVSPVTPGSPSPVTPPPDMGSEYRHSKTKSSISNRWPTSAALKPPHSHEVEGSVNLSSDASLT